MRKYTPYVLAVLILAVAAYFLFRPKADSLLALKQFAPAMFESRDIGCARVSNGTHVLTETQSKAILQEVVRPILHGARLVSVDAERRSEAHSSAQVNGIDSEGRALFLALNAYDLVDGGAIPLFMLLQKCWQTSVISELSAYPSNESAFYESYRDGMKAAEPALTRVGIDKIYGPGGRYMTPSEIVSHYESKIMTGGHTQH